MIFLLGDGAMSSETLRKSVHVQIQSLLHEIQLLARTPSLSCRTITTHKCVDAKKVYIDRDRYIRSHQVAVLATSCPISFRCRVSKDSIDAVQAACKPKSLVVFGPVRALDQFPIKPCYDRCDLLNEDNGDSSLSNVYTIIGMDRDRIYLWAQVLAIPGG